MIALKAGWNKYPVSPFTTDPAQKGRPQIFWDQNFILVDILQITELFRIENRVIFREVTAIFVKQDLNNECRNIYSDEQSL